MASFDNKKHAEKGSRDLSLAHFTLTLTLPSRDLSLARTIRLALSCHSCSKATPKSFALTILSFYCSCCSGLPPETKSYEGAPHKRNILRKEKVKRGGAKGAKEAIKDALDGALDGEEPLDPNDPLYDDEEGVEYVLVSEGRRTYDPSNASIVGPPLTLTEFKKEMRPLLEEFFTAGDVNDVIDRLRALSCPAYGYEIVKRSVSMSLDRSDRERELVSRLLSEGYPHLLPTEQLGKGFERLFESMDDLTLDVPAAPSLIASFLSRALVNEILPPSFLTDPVVCGLGGEVVAITKRKLSQDHQVSHIERIWGPGDGSRSVEELKSEIDSILVEFASSCDLDEAERCVRELRVPHFGHEITKRAIVATFDKSSSEQAKTGQLLKRLHSTDLLSSEQIQQGLSKVFQNIGDSALDAPCAPQVLEVFLEYCRDEKLVSVDFKP